MSKLAVSVDLIQTKGQVLSRSLYSEKGDAVKVVVTSAADTALVEVKEVGGRLTVSVPQAENVERGAATDRIIPATSLTGRETTIGAMDAELKSHLAEAQHHYERALAADASGASSNTAYQRTIIEQNAAILCQQELIVVMLGAVMEGQQQIIKAVPVMMAQPKMGGLAS